MPWTLRAKIEDDAGTALPWTALKVIRVANATLDSKEAIMLKHIGTDTRRAKEC